MASPSQGGCSLVHYTATNTFKGEIKMSETTRIESLETQVRTLKRMLFGVFGLVVVGGLLAAQSATVNKEQDKPMKVQLVGPITVDGVGAIVNHTVKWDGYSAIPITIEGRPSVRISGNVGTF